MKKKVMMNSIRSSSLINEHDLARAIFKYSLIIYICKHGQEPRTRTKDNI